MEKFMLIMENESGVIETLILSGSEGSAGVCIGRYFGTISWKITPAGIRGCLEVPQDNYTDAFISFEESGSEPKVVILDDNSACWEPKKSPRLIIL